MSEHMPIEKAAESNPVPSATPVQTTTSAAPATATPAAPQKKMGGLIAAIAVIVLGVVGYGIFNFINTPAQVKQQVGVAHTVYKDYNSSINKLIDNYLDDSSGNTTPESMERSIQKNDDMLKTATKEREMLEEHVANMSAGAAKSYKEQVQAYLDESEQFLIEEEASIELGNQYIEQLKLYQELSVKASGISQYMFTDPSKYVKDLGAVIEEQESIIASLKAIDAAQPYTEYHRLFIERLAAELTLLKDIQAAIEERDVDALAAAQQKYAETSAENDTATEKASDDLDTTVEEYEDTLMDIADKIDTEYTSLQQKYKL